MRRSHTLVSARTSESPTITALHHACREAEEVIPVYILSNWKKHHPWTGSNRQEFLCGCLESLSRNLEAIGGGGSSCARAIPVPGVRKISSRELRQEAIFFNRGTMVLTVSRFSSSSKWFAKNCKFESSAIRMSRFFEPNEVLTKGGRPFRIFTA